MMTVDMILLPLLSGVGLVLAIGWIRDARRWRNAIREREEQIGALHRTQVRLSTQVQAALQRRRELEILVGQLSDRLGTRRLTPEEQGLLNDIYYEYGTETHALYFSHPHNPVEPTGAPDA